MSLADLTFDRWRALDPAAARRIAEEAAALAAALAAGRVAEVGTAEHLGGRFHQVVIERDGQELALVPGGTVTLGFDPATWRPAPEQEADYAASLAEGFGHGDDLRAHLSHLLSPRRTVTVPHESATPSGCASRTTPTVPS
ncbi:hypothetical protein HD597_007591 [Nonomuraea thailandensis]|uniref:Uncharacterized protein n=1 Tax=Nonomuraea thailandensis TaxID=1188745 RepID=A0A9X2GRT4_9ACTN|nr:hypothetical protein [Nonomuraea thailandensis]MCP2360571.1 hypothetical protein [Nonomuraea thailandensis]